MATEKVKYYSALDTLRLIGFIFVSFHHFPALLSKFPVLVNQGYHGVDLFFLLSGFLTTSSLINEYHKNDRISIRSFAFKRAIRILPLYFLALVIVGAIFWAFPEGNIYRIIGMIGMIDNFLATIGTAPLGSARHLWAISEEWQFYFVILVLFIFLIKKKRSTQIFVLGGILAWLVLMRLCIWELGYHHNYIYDSPLRADSFIIGMMLGLGFFDRLINKVSSFVWLIAGGGIIAVVLYLPPITAQQWDQVYIYTLNSIGCLFLVMSMLNESLISHVLSFQPLRYLGKISYGLYVYHIFIFDLIMRYKDTVFPQWSPSRLYILGMAITIVLGIISYEAYEKQMMKIKIKTRPELLINVT